MSYLNSYRKGAIYFQRHKLIYTTRGATTDGFVYLTKNLYTAYYYGRILLVGSEDNDQLKKYVYIFKINVWDDVLQPDYDELFIINRIKDKLDITVQKSLELCGCVRVGEDIPISDAQYMKLPNTWNTLEKEEDIDLCCSLSKLHICRGKGDVSEIEQQVQNKWGWWQTK